MPSGVVVTATSFAKRSSSIFSDWFMGLVAITTSIARQRCLAQRSRAQDWLPRGLSARVVQAIWHGVAGGGAIERSLTWST